MNRITGEDRGQTATDANVQYVVRAGRGDRDAFDVLAATAVDRMYAVARLVQIRGNQAPLHSFVDPDLQSIRFST